MRTLTFLAVGFLFSCTDSFENPDRFRRQPSQVEFTDGKELSLEYDKKGVLLKETQFGRFGDPIVGIYEYDSEGRVTRVNASESGGLDKVISYRNGNLRSIEEIAVDIDGNEELVRRFEISKYEKGRIVDLMVETPGKGTVAYTYEYLSNGNLMKLNEYSFNGHGKRGLQRYKRYTYKHRKNLLKGNFAFMLDIPTFYTQNLALQQRVYSPSDVLLYSEDYEYEFESGEPVEIRVTGIDSAGNDSLRLMKLVF